MEPSAGAGVATITLDVPGKLNRVSMPAREELASVFAELGADDEVRVIVLGGAWREAFTAGGDVAGFMERPPEVLSRLAHTVGAPERCPKPVVAKLHVYTFGVGLELEGFAYGLLRSTDDFAEGVAAFVEKRPPRFTGR